MIGDSLRQSWQRLTGDDRAVSPVVGFVLIFAFLIILLTLYQTNVVPAQNEEVEFKHSQAVEADMARLGDAIDRTGSSGVSQSVTVATGVQYPDRAIAINPGAPTGSLRASSSTYTVTLDNVRATGENAKYFDPSKSYVSAPFEFTSKELVYGISYNVYQQDPRVTLAPGIQFTEYRGGTIVNSADIITGNKIDLTLLSSTSTYQDSSMAASVDIAPTSTSTEYMTIESPGSGNPTIQIETSLSLSGSAETRFENRLEDKNDKVTAADYSSASDTLTLALKDEQYQLRVAEVGIGSSSQPEAHYLVSETPLTQTVSLGEAATFTVTARDKLGNPVSGTDVTAAVDTANSGGNGSFDGTTTMTTNDEGQVTFEFRPNTVTSQPIEVDVSLDNGGGGTELSEVTYTVDAETRQGFIDNGYGIDVTIDSVNLSNKQLEIVFDNQRGESVTSQTMQLNGFLSKKNKPVTNATLGSTTIPFNGGPTSLGSDAFSVPAGGTETITLDLNDKPNGVGLLIIDVEFETASGQTLTATYATSIDAT